VCILTLRFTASRRVLLLLHIISMLLPSVLYISVVYATLLLFIPIMGRAGTNSYPDLFIGLLTTSSVVMLAVWQVIKNCTPVFFLRLCHLSLSSYILA